VFHHYTTTLVACSPFEFYEEQLQPFLHKPVPRERAGGQYQSEDPKEAGIAPAFSF